MANLTAPSNVSGASAIKYLRLPGESWKTYHSQGLSTWEQGNRSEALLLLQSALDLAISNNAGDNNVALIREQLVCLCFELGQLAEAEKHCKEAIVVLTRTYGSQHAFTANCLNNLAGVYFRQGRLLDAEAICQSVLQTYEKAYGTQHPETSLVLHNLAMIFHAQKKYAHAERNYRKAHAMRAASLGRLEPSVIKILSDYCTLLETTGRSQEAAKMRERCCRQKNNLQ